MADDIARSFAAGQRLSNTTPPKTVADALRWGIQGCVWPHLLYLPPPPRMSVGDIVWPVLQTNLSGVVTVTEEEIISTTKTVS